MEPRGALWRADAALDALVSAEPLPPRAAPASGSAPPPLDAARCAPGERAGSIRAWWREREQMLAPDRSVTLSVPSGQGVVGSRLQIVAPDCSVTLIFPSGQPVVLRRRLVVLAKDSHARLDSHSRRIRQLRHLDRRAVELMRGIRVDPLCVRSM